LENNVVKFKEAAEIVSVFKNLDQLVYFTSFDDETSKIANLVIPIRTFVETNGTYINATSLLQKAQQAFEPENENIPPLALSLAQIAYFANRSHKRYHDSSEIYNEWKNEYNEIKDFHFSSIPSMGIQLSFPKIADEPFKNKKVDFNLFVIKDFITVSKG
jgi:predicted molibdopterin-dependent oxidoreductase YjgC